MAAEKIYAISDLHVDYAKNMEWVEALSNDIYSNDTVIIAGDVTHVLTKLFKTLNLFKSKFKDVYFCPGNHDLWTKYEDSDRLLGINDSIEKFHYILKVANELGVHVEPGTTSQGVTIVPLFGWYDESLHIPSTQLESDLRLWTDYHQCQWKDGMSQSDIAKYFIAVNEKNLLHLNVDNNNQSKIITFSHFFTSKKLMEEYSKEMRHRSAKWTANDSIKTNRLRQANFTLVAGTDLLNEQLKLLKPKVHIFGHSHRKMILDIGDGTKYINNPLGYVLERERHLIEPPYELFEINLDE